MMRRYIWWFAKYLLRVAIALDQLVNAILGGYPNETLSGRAWRKGIIQEIHGWIFVQQIIDLIFFLQPNHCQGVFEYFFKPRKDCGLYMPYTTIEAMKAKYTELNGD